MNINTNGQMPAVFPVRHHAPAASRALLALCEVLCPEAVLIEAPGDAAGMLMELCDQAVPPAAVLAYTADDPPRSQMLPLALYSPEYTAVRWAREHGAAVETIDLPFAVTLAVPPNGPEGGANAESPYDLVAQAAGFHDFDTYWESRFEPLSDGFAEAALAFGETLRALEVPTPEALTREAYMRRRIHEAGARYATVLVVCGAYHAPALTQGEAMTDAEWDALPRVECKLTLMPYSYQKLSASAGYGAGVAAPYYNELLWRYEGKPGSSAGAASAFLAGVAARMRERGAFRSPAEAADAVLLARALASLRGRAPVLADLRDAAYAALGRDEPNAVAEALAWMETGAAVGHLPEGRYGNPIQDDFHRQIQALRLSRFVSPVEAGLTLDLRNSPASLDSRRSAFLHRLRVLAVPFARHQATPQARADWKEQWSVRWMPETEWALAEAVRYGVHIEAAARTVLTERVAEPETSAGMAETLELALLCGLPEVFENTCNAMQNGLSDDFDDTVDAIGILDRLLRYGSLRVEDTDALRPMLERLCLRACVDLPARCRCADIKSGATLRRFQSLAAVFSVHEPPEAWERSVAALAGSQDAHPKLSGYAFALCPDAGETLPRELARRLSSALPPEHGAAWLEGFVSHNRSVLLTRRELWEALDGYIASLDETRFREALVVFRRMFSVFTPGEKREAAGMLRALWGVPPGDSAPPDDGAITPQELEAIEALQDFQWFL